MIFFFSGWTSNRDNSLPCFILPQLHDIGSPERLQTGQLSSIELGGDSKPQLVFYPFIYLEHPVLYFQMLEYAVFVYSYICIYQSILRYFQMQEHIYNRPPPSHPTKLFHIITHWVSCWKIFNFLFLNQSSLQTLIITNLNIFREHFII